MAAVRVSNGQRAAIVGAPRYLRHIRVEGALRSEQPSMPERSARILLREPPRGWRRAESSFRRRERPADESKPLQRRLNWAVERRAPTQPLDMDAVMI
jgi:hypothetical protein